MLSSHRNAAVAEQIDQFSRRQWSAEQVSLADMATFLLQESELLPGFNAFGNDFERHRPGKGDDGAGYGRIIGAGCDVTDKFPVYFQSSDGEAPEVMER